MKKVSENQKACIFYYYTNKSTWLKEKIVKFDVMASVLTELFCQFSVVGYRSILCDRLIDSYSYKTCLKFYTALFIICVFFGCLVSLAYNDQKSTIERKKESNEEKMAHYLCFDAKYDNYLRCLIFLLSGFSVLTFISSLCYLFDDHKTRKRWDNIIMAEFIYFKSIDMSILCFFDFFDNSDLFNATLFITLEKVLWMILEAIFDSVKIQEKALIIIQIVFSSIPLLSILFFFFLLCVACYMVDQEEKNLKK